MSKIHVIRLRGPWNYEPVGRFERTALGRYLTQAFTENLPPPGRVKLPTDWAESVGPNFRGIVRYKRRFNKPSGLESGEAVWLVVEAVRSAAQLTLNDCPLGELRAGDPPFRKLITEMLFLNNDLEIMVGHPELQNTGWPVANSEIDRPGGIIGEVKLEIRGGK
jgi:hypothetical protein